jgi:transcriptional regulator with XRE-family HTH domain
MDANERKRLLGAAIRREREKQGLSQRKLALMADSNQTHIWQLEQGTVNAGIDLICRIADSLGVKVSDLIEF